MEPMISIPVERTLVAFDIAPEKEADARVAGNCKELCLSGEFTAPHSENMR